MDHYQQSQWAGWSYPNANVQYNSYQSYGDYPAYLHDSLDSFQGHHQQHLVHHHQMSRTTESKPRLSKEEVDVLEAEFQKNHKPNSTVKKALAESMRVDNARINNWFQNRRARQKKENNVRQYEARQRMERAQSDNESHKVDPIESRGLTASSAPFPSARSFARQTSLSASSATGAEGEVGDRSPPVDYQSPTSRVPEIAVSPSQIKLETTETTTAFICTPNSEEIHSSYSDQTNIRNDTVSSYFPPSNSALSQTTNDSHYGSDQDIEGLSHSSPGTTSARSASADTDAALMSSDALDIASRRNNRRPPPLSIGEARSYMGSGPRTALDNSSKNELCREMRRVASANGSVRVTKSSAAPRSPFHDRRTEGLFHLNRSPVMTTVKSTMAPPTPDTPIVAGQPNLSEAIASSNNLMAGAKIQTTGIVAHDPTLRTPPTTPGLGDPMFNLSSGYDLSISEQPLATATLGSFSSDYTLPSLSMTGSNYVASVSSATSQPVTPAYTAPMGPAYFGYGGGNSEYNWSASTGNGRTSPGHAAAFMNVTRSSFQ